MTLQTSDKIEKQQVAFVVSEILFCSDRAELAHRRGSNKEIALSVSVFFLWKYQKTEDPNDFRKSDISRKIISKFAALKPRRYVVCEMNFENFEKFVIQNWVNFKEIRNYKPHNYEVFGTCLSRRFKIAPKSGKSIRACVTSVLNCRDRHGENDKQIGLLLGGICASARVSQ